MKKILFAIITLLLQQEAAAQFIINLQMAPNPPATISEWGNRKEVFTLVITVQGGSTPKPVKLKTDIKLADGTVVATTDLAIVPVYNFTSGNNVLTATQAVPLEYLVFNGRFKTALQKTGKLPAENYLLCVRLVSAADFSPVSEERCRNFIIAAQQLPIPVMPLQESVLDAAQAQTAIIFRWTPLVPRPREPVTYRLQVFEVLPGQTPMQAFRSNLPMLDREVRGTAQYIWQPQLPMLDAGASVYSQPGDSANNKTEISLPATRRCFVWTLQTIDVRGVPVSDGNINGDGRSEPRWFYVQPGGNNPKMQQVPKNKK